MDAGKLLRIAEVLTVEERRYLLVLLDTLVRETEHDRHVVSDARVRARSLLQRLGDRVA